MRNAYRRLLRCSLHRKHRPLQLITPKRGGSDIRCAKPVPQAEFVLLPPPRRGRAGEEVKTPNTDEFPPSQNASHIQLKQQSTQGQRPHAVGTQKSVVSPARLAADNEICDARCCLRKSRHKPRPVRSEVALPTVMRYRRKSLAKRLLSINQCRRSSKKQATSARAAKHAGPTPSCCGYPEIGRQPRALRR